MTIYRSYDFLWLQVVVFKMQFKIHSQSDFFQTKTELLFFSLISIYISNQKSESEVVQSCPILCDPMECSLPHSSVYGIFQARVLEWIAISFSRGPS